MNNNTSSMRGILVACIAASLLALSVMAGCSGSSSQASSSAEASASSEVLAVSDVSADESDQSEAAEPEVLQIGEESEDALSIEVTNELGKKITDIAFMPAGSEDEPAYLMESGQVWKAGEQAIVHFQNAGEDVNYDVYVKAKGADYTLHNMKLDGVEELSICIEGDVAYATFERDGDAISTLRDEADLAEQAAAEAQESAGEEEYYEEEYYEEEYYEEPYYEEPAQEEDGCVEGGVQLR